MEKNYIIHLVDNGMLPVDTLCVLTPMLAKQKDKVAPELLNYIDRCHLWRRWGFRDLSDYVLQTGIPEVVLRCSTTLYLISELDKPCLNREHNRKAKLAIERLYEDRPMGMTGLEFADRLEGILNELTKNEDSGRGGTA